MRLKKIIVLLLGVLLGSLLAITPLNAEDFLVWDAVSGDVDGYKVYYSQEIGNYTNKQDVGNITEYSLVNSTINENETYYFVIRAYNEFGESTNSNYVEYVKKETTPPLSPEWGAVEVIDNKIKLSWLANSEPDFKQYNVYHGTSSRSYLPPVPVVDLTIYTFPSLDEGILYYFALTAVDTAGNESGWSLEKSEKIPLPDIIAPEINITSPALINDTYETELSSLNLSGTSLDNVNVALITWTNSQGGMGTAVGTTAWLVSNITLVEGENIISVQAEDAAGNKSIHACTVNYTPSYSPPIMETGEVNIDHNLRRVSFTKSFSDPVVIAKPLSLNNSDPAVIRVSNIDVSGFDISIQEWEYLDGIHPTETVGYFVIERGSYSLADGTRFEAGSFSTDKTKLFQTVLFNQSFNNVPVVITSISTVNENDAVSSRVRKISTLGFEFRMQEQESKYRAYENHITETTSYIAWEPSSGSVGGLTFEVGKTGDKVTKKSYSISFNQNFADPPVFIADMQTTDGGDTCNVRWKNKTGGSVDVLIDEEQSLNRETSHTSEVVGYMLFLP